MPDLIENGYLYIAQPPLFKTGKGKKEKYLKDEIELDDFIIKRICDKKKINIGDNQRILYEHELYLFISNLSEYYNIILKQESMGIDKKLIEILIKEGITDKIYLQDKIKVEKLKSVLIENGYEADEILWNEERNVYEIKIIPPRKKEEENIIYSKRQYDTLKIGRGLIHSKMFQKCVVLNEKISKYDVSPFIVCDKDSDNKSVSFDNKDELYAFLMEQGKKGLEFQRYKGLGEMNPNQLWETTMDPEKRIMLQVKIEDVAETDEIFTLLMGDAVEPRRNFIHKNALEVGALDI